MKFKKATTEIGIMIIAIAFMLLLGSIILDAGSKISTKKPQNNNPSNNEYPYDTYIFYLNKTEIGRQSKITESYPNIELGSKEFFNTIFIGNSFNLKANPFTKTAHSFDITFLKPEEVNYYLISFNPNRVAGNQDLIVKIDNEIITQMNARSDQLPLIITKKPKNKTVKVTFELAKPNWYEIWKWNKFEINDLKIVEAKQNRANNIREFTFDIEKEFLEQVYLDFVVDCETVKEISEPIKIKVNDRIISHENPQCTSRYNKITANIPLTIIDEKTNNLVLETQGFYKIAYSVNKIYYNDKDVYKFSFNSYDNILDVVMYGDFDKDVIDVRLNSQTISLKRDEIKEILDYLRIGTNELRILTKPVEIEELIIEKNTWNN